MPVDTIVSGTETPYRKTPPSNWGSDAERQATSRPPTNSALAQSTAAAALTPVCTVVPTISGTVAVGQILTCGTGTWVPAQSSLSFQWFRRRAIPNAFDDSDILIAGATANTRTVAAGDQGFRLFCRVTGLNATNGGSSPIDTAPTIVVP